VVKIANVDGRAALVFGESTIADVFDASGGRFGPSVREVYDAWDAFRAFAETVEFGESPLDHTCVRCAVPEPRQVFGIGINYRAHAEETGASLPPVPATFTKFPASLNGPYDRVVVEGDTVDWEVELVVVIGRRADRVDESRGWDHVAGLAVGQDISDRTLQYGAGGQFSLGKSHRGFGPIGPWVVTVDEFDDPDDLALGCSVDGEVMQDARTSDLIFGVPRLIAELSAVVSLLPGDVIFTGTPSGVGVTRQPPRFLHPGNVLESWIDGIGRMSNEIVPR
jgi:2-keto-4-pentenoate hydratase/2-oxohepta-3-ene-1,7-dioic acid hydratase in catechol pathway